MLLIESFIPVKMADFFHAKRQGLACPLCFAIAVFLTLFFPCFLQAELLWNSNPVETKVAAGTRSISQFYDIKNSGKKPVRLQRIESDCPCVTLRSQEKILKPGDSTRIEAVFDIGDRIGRQRKRITLFTDDARDSVVSWIWTIHIPEIFRIQPAFLYWQKGGETLPKEAQAEVILTGTTLKGWRLENKGFQAEVLESKPGILAFRLQPESVSTPMENRLLIELLLPDKTTRTYALRLLIR